MADSIEEILSLLACPCPKHGALVREGNELVSTCCKSRFAIDNGIPVLLPKGDSSGS